MSSTKIFELQKQHFNSNATKQVSYRIQLLKKLKEVIQSNEKEIYDAIYQDFGKSEFETFLTELGLLYHEINLLIKKTPKWSKRKRVLSDLANFPAKSFIQPEPLGVTLVIGAWNYPYQLSLMPALTAIAAGNTVILKPSELPSRTSAVMAKIINSNFDKAVFHVIEGGIPETSELLELPFDKIFFTGSTTVGKIVYEAAAKNLTPVTLELGGKSPTFVLNDTNIERTAQRIVWAKFLNAGQTCVAPDYILVNKEIETKLLEALKSEIQSKYDFNVGLPENYLQIINDRNVQRLQNLIDPEKCYLGGEINTEKRIIHPTILQNVSFEDKVMQEEIFGPILPVISYNNLDDVISYVKSKQKPLSTYIYGKNQQQINKILNEVSFGGGCVNDSMMHLSNSRLPFGGVGHSGIGSYHGKSGFDAFSHFKSVVHKSFWLEPNIKYAPYTSRKLKLIKWLLG